MASTVTPSDAGWCRLLICGESGTGKTTLIRRLLAGQADIHGFETFFYGGGQDAGLYIRRPCDRQSHPDPCGRVGVKGPVPGSAVGFPQIFDTYGVSLLRDIPPGATVMMDELGYLERDAQRFLRRITELLTGPYHVAGAIKPLDLPHLRALRTLPGVTVLPLTEANRETQFLRAQALFQTAQFFLPQ